LKLAVSESTTTTTHDPGLTSTIYLDPKQALAAELTRSTTTTTTTDVISMKKKNRILNISFLK